MIKRMTFSASALALALSPVFVGAEPLRVVGAAVCVVNEPARVALDPVRVAADAPSGMPTATEAPFVQKVSADLTKRFPTTASAMKDGYLRYTDEDDTGAISYANRQWTSADPAHPSQLWYDADGKLIGADYSVPQSDSAPRLFGVDPMRWQKFGLHVHYGLAGPGGTTIYGATGAKKLIAAGGDPQQPTAADLVKLGIAKSPSDVRFVFAFPAIWDLTVWVVPNPNGAFAEKNPNVKPQHAKSTSM